MSNGHRGRSAKQAKTWDVLPSIEFNFTGSATVGLVALNFTLPQTVLRMLGEYVISPTDGATFTAGDAISMVVGIGVVSTDAFGVGGASLPDPAGEPEFPWLFWKSHRLFIHSNTDSAVQSRAASLRYGFDIRSMRRVKPRESLAFIWQYVDSTGAPLYTASVGHTRVLLGLH